METKYQVATIQFPLPLYMRLRERAYQERTDISVIVREAVIKMIGGDESEIYLDERQKAQRTKEK